MEKTEQFFVEVRKGNLRAVEQLVNNDRSLVHIRDQRGATPFILASYYGHAEMAAFLLDNGADINETDGSGNTALMGICFKGHTDIAKLLLEKGAEVNHINAMGATGLIYAATFKQLEIARLLLRYGANSSIKDPKGNTALDHAKMQGASPLIELLLNSVE